MIERLAGWPGVDLENPRVSPHMEGEHDFGWDVTTRAGTAKIRSTGGGVYPWRVVEGPEPIRLCGFRTAAQAVDAALDLP